MSAGYFVAELGYNVAIGRVRKFRDQTQDAWVLGDLRKDLAPGSAWTRVRSPRRAVAMGLGWTVTPLP